LRKKADSRNSFVVGERARAWQQDNDDGGTCTGIKRQGIFTFQRGINTQQYLRIMSRAYIVWCNLKMVVEDWALTHIQTPGQSTAGTREKLAAYQHRGQELTTASQT
jgi:hypothetical protein